MSASGCLALPGVPRAGRRTWACVLSCRQVRATMAFVQQPPRNSSWVACTGSLARRARVLTGSVSKSGRSWSQRRHVRLAGSAGRGWHGSLQLARTRLRHTRSSSRARLFDNTSCLESRVPPPRPRVVSGGPSLVLLGNVVFDSGRHYLLLGVLERIQGN